MDLERAKLALLYPVKNDFVDFTKKGAGGWDKKNTD